MNNDTLYIKNQILSTGSVKELIDYISQNEESFISWKNYITRMVTLHGGSYEKFGRKTGFSKNTIKSWCEGNMPKNRDAFIKLAFGMRMNLDETNKLLTKYGGYSALYAKDIYDAITIYVINRRTDDWDNESYNYSALETWYDKFKKLREEHKVDGKYYRKSRTIGIFNDIISIRNDEDFERFILENKEIFLSSYSSLITFIDDFIRIRKNDFEDQFDTSPNRERFSWHKIITERGFDTALEKSLSELRQKGILPKRKVLIAIGINLNMSMTDINKMLSLANMQPLYAKDKAESLLMYILRNAEKLDPDLFFGNAYKICEMTTDSKIRAEYDKLINDYLAEENCSEEQIECVGDYIRNQLMNFDISDFFDGLF